MAIGIKYLYLCLIAHAVISMKETVVLKGRKFTVCVYVFRALALVTSL